MYLFGRWWIKWMMASLLLSLVYSFPALGQYSDSPQDILRLPPTEGFCDLPACGFSYDVGGAARAYYINDQRIEFSGLEETFAVEGVVAGSVAHDVGAWKCDLQTELFLNQPFDRNVLVDSPDRQSFAPNFEVETLQISQLYLGARRENWYVAAGRFPTPFGRYYYPIYRNNFDDSPFIRAEAIRFRETGILAQWDPEGWSFAGALTNGGFEQDSNSSKALVARAGIDRESFALGASVKVQDGVGSEGQKQFNEHFGLDGMLRHGPWTLSGEVIFDHYGFRRPGFDQQDVFWGRSLYFRDINDAYHRPVEGVGYHVNLGYEGPLWTLALNYGEYHPEQLSNRLHDAVNRRGLFKASRHWSRHLETYGVLMVENSLPNAFAGHARNGIYVVGGCQFTF